MVHWDAVSALRGELYPSEHLASHAGEIAAAHGKPVLKGTPGPLRKRFAESRAQLRAAYAILARGAKNKRDPSPAEEWLLDNSHVVEEQLREIQEDLPWGYLVQLPRIANGSMAGYPRVYGLCLDYLRHTDARVDLGTLAEYVVAYQRVASMTIGEIWAVPIMLRLGLTLIVGALAGSEAHAQDRELADSWADRLIVDADDEPRLKGTLEQLAASDTQFTAGFLVQLLKRVREHDAPLLPVVDWIHGRCEALGTTPDELTRREHLRQAADHVSVGNAITGMRAIGALDWTQFFGLTSGVEAVLMQDPCGAYPQMDEASRDRCRHAVERLARRSRFDEREVAEKALALAKAGQANPEHPAEAHLGHYLLERGRRRLQAEIGYRPSWSERLRRPIHENPTGFYLGALSLLVGALCLGATNVLSTRSGSLWSGALLTLLFALPASELALSLLHALIVFVFPPKLLPKLAFDDGIPDAHRTLVVVPCLLESRAGIAQLLEDLEVRALANADPNLYFALVTDFVDSSGAETEDDAQLLQLTTAGVAALNERSGGAERYFLLHRRRMPNAVEGRFMGWERKRGKLEELNHLLRGATDTTFSVVTASRELLLSIRYVITLDADTELPRDVAKRLVGAMAHPQNRPVFDARRQRVVQGYGIIQPRVGTLPNSSRRSRFARLFAGVPGIDPYTTAVSDVYQDLFGEGSFVGKGIYDVDAFQAALAGRVPENRMLSHDLFEGSFARSALATDIEVLDEQPATYEVVASRAHRWLRGDWQLLPWLWFAVPCAARGRRPNDLRVLDRWKLADNLRRSLVPPALVVLLALGFFSSTALAGWALALVWGVFLGPIVVRQLLSLTRAAFSPKPQLGPLGGGLGQNLKQAALGVALLLDQALLSVDGIVRTLYRLLVSRRSLLEWTTMSQATRRHRSGKLRASRRLASSAWIGLALLIAAALQARHNLPYALPILLLWVLAPALVGWLGRLQEEPTPDAQLGDGERRRLRLLARKTWRFFDVFVTAQDNWLPPDNYQEDPRGIVAHRTSPTNIGLYLLSVMTARDLGFITAGEALARLENSFATLARLERRSGHILNWYDTTNLRPLEPQYVSTVDSGNFAAYLWTLRAGLGELTQASLFDLQTVEATRDALALAAEALKASPGRESQADGAAALRVLDQGLAREAGELSHGSVAALATLAGWQRAVSELTRAAWAQRASKDVQYWLERAEAVLAHAASQAQELAPCLALLASAEAPCGVESADTLYRELSANVARASSPVALAAAAATFHAELPVLELAIAETGAPPSPFFQELGQALLVTQRACEALVKRAAAVAQQAVELADGMDFGFLFDEQRALFSIGYNVSSARLDGSHYDLLASEARLASLVAISKGDAPLEHWWKLGRPRTATSAGRSLLSWSGSMFEYLMPLLVTGVNHDTLLGETCRSAVGRQRDYGKELGVPWGVSEAAYNVMDLAMNYQYRAFGVPGLGFKNGLAEDLVVAPYATVLASLVRPDLALQNLDALDAAGLAGRFGYYEAIDYTPGHVPPERKSVVVKAFMAHHQGMSLVALGNLLCNWPMQRRFFADARVKASALLLDERVPDAAPLTSARTDQAGTVMAAEPELRLTDHVGLGSSGTPRLHLLGHGELSSIVSATGTGVITWKGLDVSRFRDDPALDANGVFVYVRDLGRRRLWSAGQQPTTAIPDYYDASFSIDRVELRRRDGAIETVMEIAVSPEHPAEVRRVTLTNHGKEAVDLDVTSYTEPVLASRGADVAHRAFSSMFLEAELLPERGAILLRRRPRSAGESENWLVQVLTPEEGSFGGAELDASRAEFLGRAGSLQKPRALAIGHKLSGTGGDVLDPGLSLRRQVRLEPGGRARVTLTTALATSREAALGLLDLVTAPHAPARAFELAWADARVELKHLGITAARSHRFQRLLSCLIHAPRALRESAPAAMALTRGKGALWSQGVSGDLPILLLCIDSADFGELCSDLLLAHEFWRINGVSCDLVLLNQEPEGYLQPLNEALQDLIRSSPAQGHENQRGGVFLRRAGQMSAEEVQLLMRAANVVLRTAAGSLSQQLRRAAEPAAVAEPLRLARRPAAPSLAATPPAADLRYFNGIGGFSSDGREYVMQIGPGARPPAPWCNVLSNEHFGSVVSEAGLGFTWHGNSQRGRLTPWSNDVVADPSGEVIYLRDEQDGHVWSATPAPASHDAEFQVRHGQGYSVFAHTQGELEHELTVLVSTTEAVKHLRLRLTNRSQRRRSLSVFGVVEWVLGPAREATRLHVCTHWDAERGVFLASNPLTSTPAASAFFAADLPVASVSGDREELFGGGSRARPSALERQILSGRVGVGLDPCAALQVPFSLAPGETREVCFVLGHAESQEQACELARRAIAPAAAVRALEAVGPLWDGLCSVTTRTPDDAFDILVNRWLPYQVVAARLWARSGFYQSSGAYGFRDQLQDSLALLHAQPALARAQILRAAARQFVEGDVQHWWHPETGEGVRTRCSDDLLFLPYAVATYVQTTGDRGVLNEMVPFLQERILTAEDEDLFGAPQNANETATLYEHCVRALDLGNTAGPHGLPKIGSGDWNDGMNRVGHLGHGESVWLGWFLVRTLQDFAPLASERGEQARASSWRAEAQRILRALEAQAWDGDWYRRAYYDDGTPIGSKEGQDCRIDAIAQSWAVIAGGDSARARRAVESSLSELVDEDARLMRLLTPPFRSQEHDPGYIRSYPEGVRENGGQYTHGVCWTVQALCMLGEGERAHWLFSLLNPISHGRNPAEVKRYRVEPYVLAGDVYGSAQHLGRGGWSWYTGSAAWMYRVAVEHMLGLQRRGDRLQISPCIPADWAEFVVTYRYGRSELALVFQNPSHVSIGVARLELDGQEQAEAQIPLVDDGRRHRALVVLGRAENATMRPEIAPIRHARSAE